MQDPWNHERPDGGTVDRVDAFDLIEEWPVGEVACVVLHADGRRWAHGDTTKPFELASVTKVLTALTVMVAVEEGTVSLDQAAGPPRSTVAHLLAHASGLAPDQRRLLTEPGRRRIYSNSGFELVAELVSTEAGIPFDTYFAEAVAEPLEMNATELAGSPAYGATASADDIALVGAELLGTTNRVLAPQTTASMTSPAFADLPGVLPGYGLQDPNTWGLGVEIRSTKSPHWTGSLNSTATFGHFGRAGTFIWVDPDASVACVVLTDREFGEWAMTRWPAFSDSVLGSI